MFAGSAAYNPQLHGDATGQIKFHCNFQLILVIKCWNMATFLDAITLLICNNLPRCEWARTASGAHNEHTGHQAI